MILRVMAIGFAGMALLGAATGVAAGAAVLACAARCRAKARADWPEEPAPAPAAEED